MKVSIERIDGLPFGRCYKITNEKGVNYLPSCTTILKMKPDAYLDMLRANLGPEKFELVTKRAADRGTVMHKWLEVFYEHYGVHKDPVTGFSHTEAFISKWYDEHETETDKVRAFKLGRSLFLNFYNKKFYNVINKVLQNEIFMYTFFRGGWAGASDFIFEDHEGTLIIQDFKSSSDPKDVDGQSKYVMQISAYMFQYAEMFGRCPDRGEILISNEKTDVVQRITVTKEQFKEPLREFLSLLVKFQSTPEWLDFQSKVANGEVFHPQS